MILALYSPNDCFFRHRNCCSCLRNQNIVDSMLGNFVRVSMSLLPKKSSGTYNRFFAVLKQSVPHSQVRIHMWITNAPLMNSFNNASRSVFLVRKQKRYHFFKLIDLHGCFFHFAQCLSRKVAKVCLIRHYKEGGQIVPASQDAEVRLFMFQLMM
uniref:Uncharacterized protein n=1 Tax=Ditylenchus dipsaci TaxID=166011 RepID=A0A915DN40_9BILA